MNDTNDMSNNAKLIKMLADVKTINKRMDALKAENKSLKESRQRIKNGFADVKKEMAHLEEDIFGDARTNDQFRAVLQYISNMKEAEGDSVYSAARLARKVLGKS